MNNFFYRQRFLLVGLVLGLVCAVFYLRARSQPSPGREEAPAENDIVATSTPSPPSTLRAANARPAANSSARPNPAFSSSEDENPSVSIVSDRPRFVAADSTAQRRAGQNDVQLQKASVSLRDYRQAFRQNPVGNNAEITRALTGKNPRGQRYLPADIQLNDKGELIDRWDKPLFFHQISGTLMEIRSAGPDHVMWTADDEVLR
jgi:hypothetical protein